MITTSVPFARPRQREVQETSLQLPLLPSTNHLFFNVKGRGRVRSKRYASWHRDAGWRIRAAKVPKAPGRIVVTVRAALPNRPRDLDNIVKPLLDALTTFNVIEDDKLVTWLAAEWAAAVAPGMVEIHVRQFDRWGLVTAEL
jgi:Holliday junction resolvase RusA-like endonuclease